MLAEYGANHEFESLLLLSELVTNALRHGRQPITITSEFDGGSIWFAVDDSGPGVPQMMAGGIEAESGRGLRLVEELAGAWGCQPRDDGSGKSVWFCLPVA